MTARAPSRVLRLRGSGGIYSVSLKANNGVGGAATQSFTLTVDQPAAITSGASTTFTAGTAGSFTVTTTGFPTAAISENGDLPAGVTFVDNGDGTATLAGTPAAGTGGSYAFTVKAINGVGAAALQSFSLTVEEAPPFTSADSATFSQKEFGSLHANGERLPGPTITVWGTLPKGVTFSGGKISGVPEEEGNVPGPSHRLERNRDECDAGLHAHCGELRRDDDARCRRPPRALPYSQQLSCGGRPASVQVEGDRCFASARAHAVQDGPAVGHARRASRRGTSPSTSR